MSIKASGRNLPPIEFELVPLVPQPEVIELFGDAGLDAWCAALASMPRYAELELA